MMFVVRQVVAVDGAGIRDCRCSYVFIELLEAFDSVDLTLLWQGITRRAGVPPQIVLL